MKAKLLTILSLLIINISFAQDKVKYTDEEKDMLKTYFFNEGFNSPATKKVSTIKLKDGSVQKGYCKGVATKKGQIHEITLKDSATSKTNTFKAEQISEAFLYASGWEKAGKITKYFDNYGMNKRTNVKKITDNDQIYFINQKVSLKNKKDDKEFLMQLINPDFSQIISVYYDPFAKETQGFSIGGSPTFGGGVIKSYYVQKGDKVMWLHKSDFEENYNFLFGDNEAFMKKYPYKSVEWDWLSALIFEYTNMTLPAV